MSEKSIPEATRKRLPMYLSYLKSLPDGAPATISSTAIANALGMGEVQVRKDIASVSSGGKPRVGYNVDELICVLEAYLGYGKIDNAVIVGAGKLGRALLEYTGFNEYGLDIVAAFDSNSDILGETLCGKKILSVSQLSKFCRINEIKIGIITVPACCAQTVCDMMISAGISAIMNFAPTHLKVPANILLQNENIAVSLALLAKRLSD